MRQSFNLGNFSGYEFKAGALGVGYYKVTGDNRSWLQKIQDKEDYVSHPNMGGQAGYIYRFAHDLHAIKGAGYYKVGVGPAYQNQN